MERIQYEVANSPQPLQNECCRHFIHLTLPLKHPLPSSKEEFQLSVVGSVSWTTSSPLWKNTFTSLVIIITIP